MSEHDSDERWLPVVGHEGYEVSDRGRVRSVDRSVVDRAGRTRRCRGRVLRLTLNKQTGYRQAPISKAHKTRQLRVHVLVIEAFVGERPTGAVVRHLDGDRFNNTVENLAWGSQSENLYDMVEHGTGRWSGRTHCERGHELTTGNVYVTAKGARSCRRCRPSYERRARTMMIRAWAQQQGMQVSDRGRLPGNVTEAWEKAHQGNAA